MHRLLLTILAAVAALGTVHAQPAMTYSTVHNRFGNLSRSDKASIRGDLLVVDNATISPIVLLDSLRHDPCQPFKYYARLANANNREGRSATVVDNSGKRRKVSSPQVGLVFWHDGRDYWKVSAHCTNSDLYNESLDRRTMTLTLARVAGGRDSVVATAQTDKGVNTDVGLNYLGVAVTDTAIAVLVGEDDLHEVMSHKISESERRSLDGVQWTRCGVLAGSGAALHVERTVLTLNTTTAVTPTFTQWTRETLDRRFAASRNPYEGYWTYLDRDMEDKWLRIGGRYTIALVETPQGYDIIYVDGAQVQSRKWLTGMLKGRMTKTIFTDNFNASWVDATFEPITDDVYATFESGAILTLKFPVYASQLRFSKVLPHP